MTRGHRFRRLVATVMAVGLGVATAGTPGPARAEQPVFGGDDWYASAYGALGLSTGDANNADPSWGATVSAGFRFNRWLTGELGGEYAHKFSYDAGTGALTCSKDGRQADFFNAWQVSAGGRAYLTESQIQPFVLAHAGFMQTRDRGAGRSCTSNGMITRLGGGVEVFVTNGLAVSLLGAYVLPVTGNVRGHDYVSVGLGITWY